MVLSRRQRRATRAARATELFGPGGEAALDLLELTEFAWHDCYADVTPPDDVVVDIFDCSAGDLAVLVRAARLAVEDRRDLRVWAERVRRGRSGPQDRQDAPGLRVGSSVRPTVGRPFVRQVALDCRHPRVLAEFYREFLGYAYRPGDEAPPVGEPDPRGEDWLVLRPEADNPRSGRGLAFQQSDSYESPVWSADEDAPTDAGVQRQMLHLDLTVPDVAALERERDRATALGAHLLLDRSADDEEPLYVLADPAGHPFCVFVA